MTSLRMTVAEMMACSPCGFDGDDDGVNYTPERVTALYAGRESLSALDILALDIPEADRLWAVLRPSLIAASDLHELACRFADSVVEIYEREHPGDYRPRKAIAMKRWWVLGEATDGDLAAASAAAWAAARAASWDAAWAAAGAAAGAASWDAAWAAASAAAWAAAGAAAGDAAMAAARAAARAAAWAAAGAAASAAAWAAAMAAARDSQVCEVVIYLTEMGYT